MFDPRRFISTILIKGARGRVISQTDPASSNRWHSSIRSRFILALCIVFGAAGSAPQAAVDAQEETTICLVQGDGFESPMKDDLVSIEGQVVADFTDTVFDGFFLQAPGCDENPATSNGIWVYDGNHDAEIAEGSWYRVSGRVAEHFALTEIQLDAIEETVGPAVVVDPTLLDIPADHAQAMEYLEAHEGMLVDPGRQHVVGGTNAYGEPYVVPASAGIERVYRTTPEGRRLGLIFPGDWQRLDFADKVEGAIGGLTFTYDNYKIAIRDGSQMQVDRSGREAPVAASAAEGEMTLATYNLENFFDSIDDPGRNDADWTVDEETYARMVAARAKSIARSLNFPDIISLEEVEKHQGLKDMAAHPSLADANYGTAHVDGPDGRGIDVGFMYRQDRWKLLSHWAAQACTEMNVPEPKEECEMAGGGTGWKLFSRPPLVGRFEHIDSGRRITVIGNHFKSKRGGDEATIPVRVRMAEHVLDLIDEFEVDEPDVPVVVVGDLNAFIDEAAILLMTEERGSLRNLWLDESLIDESERYSFIFNGVSQILDFILTPADLVVRDFEALHFNTDFGQDSPDDEAGESPRVSDHDPLLLRLDIESLPKPAFRAEIFLPILLPKVILEDSSKGQGGGGGGDPTPDPTDPPGVDPAETPVPTERPDDAPPASPLRIDELFYDGVVPRVESDEYIEFTNVGDDELDLSNWQIISVQGLQNYKFPDGFKMAKDQQCRVYTDEIHPDQCGLSWGESEQAVWSNTGDKAEIRDPDGTLIDWFCYGNRVGECG